MNYTHENLKKAFAGESQANRKYLAFAKKADEEGLIQVAKLFRAAAEAETIHALAHLEKLDMVKSTEENLKHAIEGETHEADQMYPAMILHAREENNQAAEIGFKWANAVEAEHADLYKTALEKMGDLNETDYYVCQVCGHTHEGEPEGNCPVCGAPKEKFKRVE
ncbi:rubrerythrin family protein [Patescibacteria group bacterium]|nr:rubrerythrin family protein [Patescibacteria group bacterium]